MRVRNEKTMMKVLCLIHDGNCQYHIVFTPKYRRKAIYKKFRRDIGIYLRRPCDYKGVEIIGAQTCTDYIHILVKTPIK